MNEGKIFEQDVRKSMPPNVYYFRIQDSASGWSNTSSETIRFTPRNPYDCFIYQYPNLVTLELKSTKGTAFSFKGKTPMIKEHQIEGLMHSASYHGIKSGFIFNFRAVNRTYFMNITDFVEFKINTTKNSINENDIILHNGVLIESELLRTRYRYNIYEFLKNIF